jgi:hypothetical protein
LGKIFKTAEAATFADTLDGISTSQGRYKLCGGRGPVRAQGGARRTLAA